MSIVPLIDCECQISLDSYIQFDVSNAAECENRCCYERNSQAWMSGGVGNVCHEDDILDNIDPNVNMTNSDLQLTGIIFWPV